MAWPLWLSSRCKFSKYMWGNQSEINVKIICLDKLFQLDNMESYLVQLVTKTVDEHTFTFEPRGMLRVS